MKNLWHTIREWLSQRITILLFHVAIDIEYGYYEFEILNFEGPRSGERALFSFFRSNGKTWMDVLFFRVLEPK